MLAKCFCWEVHHARWMLKTRKHLFFTTLASSANLALSSFSASFPLFLFGGAGRCGEETLPVDSLVSAQPWTC